MKAKVAEVFKSIQGEGIYLGEKQVFVRFYGCNLDHCRFCDTKLRSFKEYEPPELLERVKSEPGDFHSVSLTGGEPLVQSNFLKDFLPLVKQEGLRTYLETNATLPEALKDVIEYIDIVAADFKLPSSTGLKDFRGEHEAFLRIALRKEVFVKAVICKSTDLADLKRAVELLAKLKRDIPFVLQPNSFEFDMQLTDKIREFKNFALEYLSDVRRIPQMHKIAGVK
ncbi:MAG: 7-carboxy-7-deazaguanine synthase QueE [Candidatus Omnitrophota bacterium]